MKYIGHRFVRYCRAPQKRRSLIRRLCALLTVLMIFWAVLCELALSAVTPQLVEEAVRSYVLSCMNRAVAEQLDDFEESFVTVTEQDGTVSLLQMDQSAMNTLKANVAEVLEKSINRNAAVSIPIGSLCGVKLLNGRGPAVPLKLHLEGGVSVSFRSELTTAGVNQSCHRVLLELTVSACSQSKKFPAQITECTETVLSETVIVGEVPGVVWSSAD